MKFSASLCRPITRPLYNGDLVAIKGIQVRCVAYRVAYSIVDFLASTCLGEGLMARLGIARIFFLIFFFLGGEL